MAIHRFLVRYTPAEGGRDKAKEFETEEKTYVVKALESGGAVSVGRFADLSKGALGIFESKEAAEAFVKDDPFRREGVWASYTIAEWNEVMAAGATPAG